MNEEMRTRTYEELLVNRVAKAFESMDNVNAEFCDEIIDELEMLFKLKPDLYEQLIKWKQYNESIFQQNIELAKKKVSLLDDEIAQDITIKYYQTKIEWSYRKDMLEVMINLLNEFKLIPFTNPEYAEIETVMPEISETEQPTSEEVYQPPPPPPPTPIAQKPVARPQPIQPAKQVMPPTRTYNQPPQAIEPDDELVREANRLAREEEEIKKLSLQPKAPVGTPLQRPKKGLGLFKKI